jgi:hypothetical protein
LESLLIGRNEKVKNSTHTAAVSDGLLRPEPKPEENGSNQGGLALLGLTFAAFALVAIYASAPIDSPEWPDCPIQTLGSCGEK